FPFYEFIGKHYKPMTVTEIASSTQGKSCLAAPKLHCVTGEKDVNAQNNNAILFRRPPISSTFFTAESTSSSYQIRKKMSIPNRLLRTQAACCVTGKLSIWRLIPFLYKSTRERLISVG